MEHYTLEENEVVLYRGNVNILTSWGNQKNSKFKKVEYYLTLTNLNFVFMEKKKQLLKKEVIEKELYAVDSVKFYNNNPHIIRKDAIVEIYFKEKDKIIEFESKKEARIFADTALRLVSGKSKFVRAVQKVQKEVSDTNEALGIDVVGGAQAIASIATDIAIEVSEQAWANKKMKCVGLVAKVLKGKRENKATLLKGNEIEIKQIESAEQSEDE